MIWGRIMNIKSKLNWKLGFLSPLILSPLIVASCASVTSEQQQQPTQVVEQIPAAVLQLENLKPAAALAKIDANLIFQARNQIFQNHKIDKVDQIRLLDSQVISESSILVDVELAAQAYYDSQGNLGYQAKQFTFAISGFQAETQPPIADAEQIQAHLQQLANQATFDVANKTNLFASQVSAQQINWNEAQANSEITFKAFNLIFDDAAGKLGFSALFAYKNINQFIKIDPKSSRAISGFKIKNDSQLNDQQAVGIEILRLINLNQAGNLVAKNIKFTIQEIQNFIAQPNSFKAYLNNLNAAFTYEINSFFLNNFLQNKAVETMRATINLTVGKNQFKAPVELQFNVQVETNWDDNVKPSFLDPTTVIQHEEKRLKNLNSKLKLHQNAFNQEEVTRLKANPNSLFQLLGGFLPEQYFQYQINPLNITNDNNGLGSQTLTFKIKGRLWRDPSSIKKEVESNLFSFQINVYEDSLAAQPPTDLSKTWKIESKNGGDQDIEVDFQNKFDLARILTRDGSGKVDVDATKFDAFLRKIATESSTTFFNITGILPDDWSWDEYLEGFAPEINNQKTGLTGTLLLQYPDSQNLSESLNVFFTFKNMTYDENLVEDQPTDKEQFDKFVTDFQTTIKPKAQLDANAIHSGRQNVFQFSQLHENNFLNFTNTNWEALLKPIQNKIAITAVNSKFNYLLNTI